MDAPKYRLIVLVRAVNVEVALESLVRSEVQRSNPVIEVGENLHEGRVVLIEIAFAASSDGQLAPAAPLRQPILLS